MGRNSGGGSRRSGGSSSGGGRSGGFSSGGGRSGGSSSGSSRSGGFSSGSSGRISGGRTTRVPGTGSAGRNSSYGKNASAGGGSSSGWNQAPPPGSSYHTPPPGPSYHFPPPRGPRPPRYGFWGRRSYPPPPPGYGGGPYYHGRRPASGGCFSAGCIMPFIFIFLIAALVGGCMSGWGRQKSSYSVPQQPAQYAQNQVQQTPPAPAGQNSSGNAQTTPAETLTSDYFTDTLGWIKSTSALDPALIEFEEETGVHPYLYLTEDISGNTEPSDDEMDRFANGLYDRLFTDENHFLLIFQEYGDFYMTWYVCGNEAAKIIDGDAANIVLDYIDKLYASDMEDEEFFSTVFTMSAKDIMKDKS